MAQAWSAANLPAGLSINATTGEITGTAPVAGLYAITVTVTDSATGLSDTEIVTINVSAPATSDPVPQVTNPGAQSAAVGTPTTLQIVATDDDSLTYSATDLPPGLTLNTSTGEITGTPTLAGTYATTVTATDGTTPVSVSFSWAVAAEGGNAPALDAVANQAHDIGDAVSIQLAATDPDSDPLTFSAAPLPFGVTINANTGLISGTLLQAFDGTVTVGASDGTFTTTGTFEWAVTEAGGARVAVLAVADHTSLTTWDTSMQSLLEGLGWTVTPHTYTDTEQLTTDGYNIAVLSNSIPAFNLDQRYDAVGADSLPIVSFVHHWESGHVTGTPDLFTPSVFDNEIDYVDNTTVDIDGQALGSIIFRTTADTQYFWPASAMLPDAVVWAEQPGSDAVAGFTLAAGDDNASSVALDANVVNMSNAFRNTHDWTTVMGDIMEAAATFATGSAAGGGGPANTAPTLTNPGTQTDDTGTTVSLQPVASDPDAGAVLEWSASGLPTGLQINPNTGEITGTIGQAADASNTVTLTVSDGTDSDSETFTWDVPDGAVPTVPLDIWRQAPIGAGGLFIDVQCAGSGSALTVVLRNDTEGLKLWNPATPGFDRIFPENLPASEQGHWQRNAGIYSFWLSPSDPNIIYVACNTPRKGASIWKTINKGQSWVDVTPPGYGPSLDGNDYPREASRMIGHPTNPNIVLAADETKMWRTSNGGTSWSDITAAVGGPQTVVPGTFGDKRSFVGMTVNPTNPNEFYVGNPTANTFYRSNDAGSSFSPIGRGPVMDSHVRNFRRLRSDAWLGQAAPKLTFTNIRNNSAGLDQYDPVTNTWSVITMGGAGSRSTDTVLTVNPANRDQAIYSAALYSVYGGTSDGGATWATNGAFDNAPACVSSTGIGWHNHGGGIATNTQLGYRMNSAAVDANGEWWCAGGNNGVAHVPFVTAHAAAMSGGQLTLTVEGRGTDNICPAVILAPSGAPRDRGLFVGFWDEGRGNLDRDGLLYPHKLTRHFENGPPSPTLLTGCWGADFAKNDSSVVVAVPSQTFHFLQSYLGGISTDYGDTFTQFAVAPWEGKSPYNTPPDAYTDVCGMTAILACSTATNFMILGGANTGLRYTKDGAATTWDHAIIDGLDYGPSDPNTAAHLNQTHWADFFHRQYIQADPLIAGKFWFLNMTNGHAAGAGLQVTTDGGDTWTRVAVPAAIPDYNAFIWHSGFIMAPGRSNHLWMYPGQQGSDPDNNASDVALSFSTDGGATFTEMNAVREPVKIAFGKEAPGASYPTLYMCGYVDKGTGYQHGYWANPDPLNNSAADWVKLGDSNPLDRSDVPISMAADPDVHGIVYSGNACVGIITGDFAATIAAG